MKDKEVGLIVKTKKTNVIETLEDIHTQLEVAKQTGRYLLYSNKAGILPSDLANEIDIAITFGHFLPATFIEMALCGCRVIHYDSTDLRVLERGLYDWGYEKVIFDSIEKIILSCKRYKENSELEPGLGDFSEYIAELDPFRDGKASIRVSTYFKVLLACFDKGKGLSEALQYTNKVYTDTWGKKKIIGI